MFVLSTFNHDSSVVALLLDPHKQYMIRLYRSRVHVNLLKTKRENFICLVFFALANLSYFSDF